MGLNRRSFLVRASATLAAAASGISARAQEPSQPRMAQTGARGWSDLPVRALLLSAPQPSGVPGLCRFIRDVLPAEGVTSLVLRIRYGYQFASHPELADAGALSKAELKQVLRACRDAGVKLIPKMNLFGHQSDGETILPLLAKYPQLDESPDYGPPHPWRDGGAFGCYCKSLWPGPTPIRSRRYLRKSGETPRHRPDEPALPRLLN